MQHKRHWLLILLDLVLILVSIGAAFALLFALIAGHVSSQTTTFFAFFALAAPMIYLANILLLAMWVARWSGWAFVPLTVMLWGVWSVGEFVQIDFTKNYNTTKQAHANELSIMTYNVHGFRSPSSFKDNSIADVLHFVASVDADIVCLQEYQVLDSTELLQVDNIMHGWPYRAYMYDVASEFNHWGQVVFSKFPLSKPHPIAFDGSNNGAMYVDVYSRVDTTRLFNCHLQTTAFNQVNHERGVRVLLAADDSKQMAMSVARGLKHNFKIRAAQADTVAMLIKHSPYEVIAVGDLNSPPMTYTYHTIRGEMADAFCESGSGYGYTYKPMAGIFRIDYLFFDKERFDCLSYLSPDKPWSDHNAVIVELKYRDR